MKEQKASAIAVACSFLSSAFALPKQLISIHSILHTACLPACLFCVIFSAYGSKHGEFHQPTIFFLFTTWKQMNVYNMLCSNTVTVAKSKTEANQKKEKSPPRVNWKNGRMTMQRILYSEFISTRYKTAKEWKMLSFVIVFVASFESENAHMPNTEWLLLRFVSCFENSNKYMLC